MLSKKSSKNSSLRIHLHVFGIGTPIPKLGQNFIKNSWWLWGIWEEITANFPSVFRIWPMWHLLDFFFYTNDYIFLLCFILITNWVFFHNQMKRLLLLNNISFECVVSMQHFLINILFIAPHYNFLLCLTEKTIMNFPPNETLLLSAKAICLPTAGMCVSLAFRGTRPVVSYGDLEEFMYIMHKVCHIHMEINCSPK